ncbi:PWI domain containing protein [Mitosporidium daphniae]|uniref:PWI domain containing protein n=1 Tax=Mitosporidium daphniae TaxID=1485682 RepID=A0A098VYW8_9MICR|nr:PWI domain containing protein [Mitosporidium daphniae]KGG52906.1 PWI domain containing protein [Mitosporidium daphniae]|eukprot:XP_013239342.1 PWI domain containing protein [Mitosporidium daphniae]
MFSHGIPSSAIPFAGAPVMAQPYFPGIQSMEQLQPGFSSALPGIPLIPPTPIVNPATLLSSVASSTSLPVYNTGLTTASSMLLPSSSSSSSSSHVIQAGPELKSVDVYSTDPSLIYKPVEDLMGGQVSTTAFIGSLSDGVSDDLIQKILENHTAFDAPAREQISELLKSKNIPFFWNDPNAPLMPQVDASPSAKSDPSKLKSAPNVQPSEYDIERDLERALRELDRLAEQEQERKEAQYKEVFYLHITPFLEDERREKQNLASLRADHEAVVNLHLDYSTFVAKDQFFLDRNSWRASRARLLSKEHNLLTENDLSFIKSEMEKILSLSLFEDRLYKNTAISLQGGSAAQSSKHSHFYKDEYEDNERAPYPRHRHNSSSKEPRVSILKQKMGLNLPEWLTIDELIASGMSSEDATAKSNAQQKHRLELLAKILPTDRSDVFHFDVFWPILDNEKKFFSTTLPQWLTKKLPEVIDSKTVDSSPFIEAILHSIRTHKNPFKLVSELTFLLEGDKKDKYHSDRDESEKSSIFILKLWRFLILESERLLLSRE